MNVNDLLLAAPSQAGQKTADGLDAVLRIAGEPDDRFRTFDTFGVPPPTGGVSMDHSFYTP